MGSIFGFKNFDLIADISQLSRSQAGKSIAKQKRKPSGGG